MEARAVPIRIFLVDDHPAILEGLKYAFQSGRKIHVAGTARDGAEALKKIPAARPEVVLMDVRMPVMDGFAAARSLMRDSPAIAVVFYSAYHDRAWVAEAMRIGARGFISKDASYQELARTIQDAARGKSVFRWAEDETARGPEFREAEPRLSEREVQTLTLLTNGHTTKEIAAALQLSPRTVDTYRELLKNKLQLHSLPELTKYAIQRGYTNLRV